MNTARRVQRVLLEHPAIEAVQLVGSRARGEPTPFSDWDFEIATDRFDVVAEVLPALVRPLRPIAQQWDRLSRHWTYMLVLEGPEKVDLLLGGSHRIEGPWTVSSETLPGIDDHFWDWILWLLSKEAAGRQQVVGVQLEQLFEHILRPMSVTQRPANIDGAMESYLEARATQERILHVRVSRTLQDEVQKSSSDVKERHPLARARAMATSDPASPVEQ